MNGLKLKAASKKNKSKKLPLQSEPLDNHFDVPENEISLGTIGNLFNNRYLAIKYISYGTFATIWLVYDVIKGEYYAMKMQGNKYYRDAKIECNIMKRIGKSEYTVNLIDDFEYTSVKDKKYFCMILELMGMDLFTIMEEWEYISLDIIKKLISDLLKGVKHIHKMGYMHTDLKMENLLMRELDPKLQKVINWFNTLKVNEYYKSLLIKPKEYDSWNKAKKQKYKKSIKNKAIKQVQKEYYDKIVEYITNTWNENENENEEEETHFPKPINDIYLKVSDFGSCYLKDNNVDGSIQTREFRSPEVIIGYDINEKIDIWSIGCIVYELLNGNCLFDPTKYKKEIDTDREHLSLFFEMFGKLPSELWEYCDKSEQLFDNKGRIKGHKRIEYTSLETHLRDLELNQFDSDEELDDFCRFLSRFFKYVPKLRPSARELLDDPWFILTEQLENNTKQVKKTDGEIDNSNHEPVEVLVNKFEKPKGLMTLVGYGISDFKLMYNNQTNCIQCNKKLNEEIEEHLPIHRDCMNKYIQNQRESVHSLK